jgi:hypothetical protein
MRLLVLLLLVAAAGACVTNGYGEDGEGGCALIYCNKGYEPDESHERCVPCPKGRYSETQDMGSCDTCPNIPVHADPSFFGETGPGCAYICHPGTYGPYCQDLFSVLWRVVFLLMAVGALWEVVRRLNQGKKTR